MIVNLKPGEGFRLPKVFDRNGPVYKKIYDFIKDSIEKEIKKNDWYTAQSLFGGDNYDWCKLGYPIGDFWIALNDDYLDRGMSEEEAHDAAVRQAGIYVGMIIKYISHYDLSKDVRIERSFNHIVYNVI